LIVDRGHATEAKENPANGNFTPEAPTQAISELEMRVTRLEDALASMHDTAPLEERVVERVSRRLECQTVIAPSQRGLLVDATRPLLPTALHLLQDRSDPSQYRNDPQERLWLVHDVYEEGRAIVRMFLDRRYRPTWQGKFVPLALLFAILTSWIWLPGTSILPTTLMVIVDKIVDLLLAFCAFKVLSREAKRYRAALAEMPGDLRS
jgi:hypothetical protein